MWVIKVWQKSNTKVVPKRISKVIRFSVEFVSSRTKRVEKLQLLEKSKL